MGTSYGADEEVDRIFELYELYFLLSVFHSRVEISLIICLFE